MRRTFLRAGLSLLVVALVATPAGAQVMNRTAPTAPTGWHEQTSEFGTAQALYQDVIDGSARPFEAKFWLNTHYNSRYGPDRGVTYFLFAFDTQRSPLRGTIDSIVDGISGEPLPIYRKEHDASARVERWIVDAANMPPPTTPLVLRGTVHAQGTGQYQAGALIQPFTYRWEPVQTAGGTPAMLYIPTQYGVNRVTETGCEGPLCSLGKIGNPIPVVAVGGAILAAVVAVGLYRRRR